jgi:predicted lipoprotein with Yx(FWY)xxD motif
MRPTLKYLLPTLAASLTLAACGSSSKSQGSAAAPASTSSSSAAASSSEGTKAVVRTASNATLGATVLTDSKGMTLYRLSGEQNGKFICTSSACTHVWHPVTASGAGAASGGVASLGTVKRPDGTEQVTYKGMPLYTFTGDQQAGDAKGQGLKDVGIWSALKVSASSAPAAQSAPASQPAPSKGGYAY